MASKPIAICGAGGFGREVRWLIDGINTGDAEWDFVGYFDDDADLRKVDAGLYLGPVRALEEWSSPLAVVFAIGSPQAKRRLIERVKNPALWFPTLIHPACCVGSGPGSIGEGSIICAGTIITVDVQIGRHVILNLGCTVGHDTIIGDYSSFMPTVNISGEVLIGEAVYVGTGASIVNRVEIGRETIVGAGAVVTESLPPYCTAVGVPARPIEFRGAEPLP